MKQALVTGSAGFVGRHMVRALVEAGYQVRLVDIANGHDCRQFFADPAWQHYDLVVHCAAVVGGRAMINGEPLRLMVEDLSIDAALFGWALRARPGRIVYFSSSAAYPIHLQSRNAPGPLFEGQIGEEWIGEHARWDNVPAIGVPDATYGWVKLTGERLAAEANAAGIPTHVFRPFSGYGTDQALDYPWPKFIRRALDRDDPFEIWGAGDSARDWVHINDVVGAVLAAIDQDVLGPVNICTGRATTFDKLAKMVMDAAGYEAPIKYVDGPQGVHWRVGDPTKMLEFYTPRVSLEDGIARAIRGWQ